MLPRILRGRLALLIVTVIGIVACTTRIPYEPKSIPRAQSADALTSALELSKWPPAVVEPGEESTKIVWIQGYGRTVVLRHDRIGEVQLIEHRNYFEARILDDRGETTVGVTYDRPEDAKALLDAVSSIRSR